MTFFLSKEKSILNLKSSDGQEISFYVSRRIPEEQMHQASLNEIIAWSPFQNDLVKVTDLKNGWRINANGSKTWRKWWIKSQPQEIIYPTREGELISNPNKIPNFGIYSLSYPGTASTKCVVLFTGKHSGVVIGSGPSLSWAKITLTRLEKDIILQFLQNDGELYIFPFKRDWQEGVKEFRNYLMTKTANVKNRKILKSPRFLLQMGVRDFFGRTIIKKFTDLLPLINQYGKVLGRGNVVHFFGTNPYGFDDHFPDFTFDEKLGGLENFSELIAEVHKLGLFASHHFNPRIADARWLEANSKYKDAVVINPSGNPWIEFYKNNIYYTMNPNNKNWQDLCINTINYLRKSGVDFVEIDQIAYQRNLYTNEEGFGQGYQDLIELCRRQNIKFWVEGVSDVFDLPSDCYFQVLPRDRAQLWETNENRRGYVYGSQFTSFYRTLMPHSPISYQIVTEKAKVNLIPKRLRLAKKLKVQIYDLELGFVDKLYKSRLEKTLKKIHLFLKRNPDFKNATSK